MVIWFIGMSGVGKTTLCYRLKSKLEKQGKSVFWLDGDEVRKRLGLEGDFSREGILKNNFAVIKECQILNREYDYVLVSLIAPLEESRQAAKQILGENYIEIYLKADIHSLMKRDTKGLYKLAREGKIDNLIGFSEKTPFEHPEFPNLIFETDQTPPDEIIECVVKYLPHHPHMAL